MRPCGVPQGRGALLLVAGATGRATGGRLGFGGLGITGTAGGATSGNSLCLFLLIPAKQIFQAIRIEVNDELGAADESIQQAMDLLAVGGRISVITFHSLEDRLTKQLFKEASTVDVPKGLPFIPEDLKPKMELVSRKPILPSQEELENNNRAHSAKLRVAQKIHK